MHVPYPITLAANLGTPPSGANSPLFHAGLLELGSKCCRAVLGARPGTSLAVSTAALAGSCSGSGLGSLLSPAVTRLPFGPGVTPLQLRQPLHSSALLQELDSAAQVSSCVTRKGNLIGARAHLNQLPCAPLL